MEYMKIEGFLGGAVSKLINKGIESKFGYKPDIELRGFKLYADDDNDYIQIDTSIRVSREDFNKLIEEATK